MNQVHFTVRRFHGSMALCSIHDAVHQKWMEGLDRSYPLTDYHAVAHLLIADFDKLYANFLLGSWNE